MSKNFEILHGLQKKSDSTTMIKRVGIVPFAEKIFSPRGTSSPRIVAFAGIDSGECCSRMIAEVAITLARTDHGKVCLVDAYFHSPSLSEFLALGNPAGLIEASQLEGPILDFTIPVRDGNLSLVPWGSLETSAGTYLALEQMKNWLDELCREFKYVLVNAPPLDQFANAIAFGQLADGLVPVLDGSLAEPAGALRQMERLRQSHVRIRGLVWDYTHLRNVEGDEAKVYGTGRRAANR
jgi:Mrp family chromosome partitioning ATPase